MTRGISFDTIVVQQTSLTGFFLLNDILIRHLQKILSQQTCYLLAQKETKPIKKIAVWETACVLSYIYNKDNYYFMLHGLKTKGAESSPCLIYPIKNNLMLLHWNCFSLV